MRKTVLFAILFSTVAHAQTARLKERAAVTTATPCEKSSGINVFINLDARPTTLAKGSQKAHIAPAKSLEVVSQFEANLKAQGFCVFHNDEFDGAGNMSVGDVAPGTAPHVDIAFLAHVVSFPESLEFLVYRMEFQDWTTVPALPYYLVDEGTDTAALARKLAGFLQSFVTRK